MSGFILPGQERQMPLEVGSVESFQRWCPDCMMLVAYMDEYEEWHLRARDSRGRLFWRRSARLDLPKWCVVCGGFGKNGKGMFS
jgi:hypothetical protein